MIKTLAFLLIFFVVANCYGQDSSSHYQLVVKYNNKSASKKLVPKSDSINIVFLYNYSGDIVRFKTDEYEFVSDTLRDDNIYGICGGLKIAKRFLKGPVKIYFNNEYVGSLRVNRKYSLAHLEYNKEHRIFTWRYQKYRFIFL